MGELARWFGLVAGLALGEGRENWVLRLVRSIVVDVRVGVDMIEVLVGMHEGCMSWEPRPEVQVQPVVVALLELVV